MRNYVYDSHPNDDRFLFHIFVRKIGNEKVTVCSIAWSFNIAICLLVLVWRSWSLSHQNLNPMYHSEISTWFLFLSSYLKALNRDVGLFLGKPCIRIFSNSQSPEDFMFPRNFWENYGSNEETDSSMWSLNSWFTKKWNEFSLILWKIIWTCQ